MFEEIISDIRTIKSTPRDLRNFAYIVGGIFLALGVWFYIAGRRYSLLAAGIGVALILAGRFYAKILKPFHRCWMALGTTLGFVMTRVILLVAFYIIVTPLAAVMRLLGKRPLEMEFRPKNALETYWHYREVNATAKERLEKQF